MEKSQKTMKKLVSILFILLANISFAQTKGSDE